MIHYKKEGHALEIGLNITVGVNKGWLPWITFCWAWYTPANHQMRGWRLRIRTWRFKIFYTSERWDVIYNYLKQTDQRLIKRELIEDLRLHAFLHKDRTLDGLLNRYRLPESF